MWGSAAGRLVNHSKVLELRHDALQLVTIHCLLCILFDSNHGLTGRYINVLALCLHILVAAHVHCLCYK